MQASSSALNSDESARVYRFLYKEDRPVGVHVVSSIRKPSILTRFYSERRHRAHIEKNKRRV